MKQEDANPKPSKKKPSEIARTAEGPANGLSLTGDEWEEFQRGVQLFNSGEFWLAHEAWENVWKKHEEDERLFFQGLIQMAAAFHQVDTHASHKGLLGNFTKAYAKLEVFSPNFLGVYVKPLLKAIETCRAEAEERGERGMKEFPQSMYPRIQFHQPDNPDLKAELHAVFTSPGFREGVSLFNEGLFWEAHEAWEAIWRDLEGEAKQIMHAFVQAGSGYSFMRMGKSTTAVYSIQKSLAVFEEFGSIDSVIEMAPLIDHMRKLNAALIAGAGSAVRLSSLGPLPFLRFR